MLVLLKSNKRTIIFFQLSCPIYYFVLVQTPERIKYLSQPYSSCWLIPGVVVLKQLVVVDKAPVESKTV